MANFRGRSHVASGPLDVTDARCDFRATSAAIGWAAGKKPRGGAERDPVSARRGVVASQLLPPGSSSPALCCSPVGQTPPASQTQPQPPGFSHRPSGPGLQLLRTAFGSPRPTVAPAPSSQPRSCTCSFPLKWPSGLGSMASGSRAPGEGAKGEGPKGFSGGHCPAGQREPLEQIYPETHSTFGNTHHRN